MQEAKKSYYLTYLLITAVLSFTIAFVTKSHSGFFIRLLGATLAVPAGFIGFLVGDFIRKLAIPDAVLVSGGFFALLRTRLFWMCGPQLIGMLIGIFMMMGQVIKVAH